MKKQILKVVFRKFDNDEIIALFPEITFGYPHYKMMSYMSIGQHYEVDHHAIIQQTKLATEDEYKTLLKEIEKVYHEYEIKVMKKINIKW